LSHNPVGLVLKCTNCDQTRNLAGHTADPRFLQKIAFVSLNHHAAIERLDTIRAFHFGSHFLVEVKLDYRTMVFCIRRSFAIRILICGTSVW
uniref:C2H2-type domain-containing protein n=1 Tax=Echinostoma caproni TaxID=27848 RepID=A0A183APN6_9TREM